MNVNFSRGQAPQILAQQSGSTSTGTKRYATVTTIDNYDIYEEGLPNTTDEFKELLTNDHPELKILKLEPFKDDHIQHACSAIIELINDNRIGEINHTTLLELIKCIPIENLNPSQDKDSQSVLDVIFKKDSSVAISIIKQFKLSTSDQSKWISVISRLLVNEQTQLFKALILKKLVSRDDLKSLLNIYYPLHVLSSFFHKSNITEPAIFKTISIEPLQQTNNHLSFLEEDSRET